jgi:hypothetical protein
MESTKPSPKKQNDRIAGAIIIVSCDIADSRRALEVLLSCASVYVATVEPLAHAMPIKKQSIAYLIIIMSISTLPTFFIDIAKKSECGDYRPRVKNYKCFQAKYPNLFYNFCVIIHEP